ncbi:MAG: GntR family transcriptional regulator [Desulfobacteraceae bacterium]|nr:MAG: GntR family transcriptional regulator [Desulfobacteraceae bacterium]
MARQNLEEFVYESIIRLIHENHFRPGDVLLETELAEMLELKSRTPVRHALGQLVASGFLEKRKKKGCIIPPATPEDAAQVFFARECIEGNIAFSAAFQATDDHIARLYEIAEIEAETGRAGQKFDYSLLNRRFHETIAKACGNKYFKQYSDYLFWRSHVYVFLFGGYYTHDENFVEHMLSPPQHIKIVEAIEKRDAEGAKQLMIDHIRFTFKKIFNLIKGNGDQPFTAYFKSRD